MAFSGWGFFFSPLALLPGSGEPLCNEGEVIGRSLLSFRSLFLDLDMSTAWKIRCTGACLAAKRKRTRAGAVKLWKRPAPPDILCWSILRPTGARHAK